MTLDLITDIDQGGAHGVPIRCRQDGRQHFAELLHRILERGEPVVVFVVGVLVFGVLDDFPLLDFIVVRLKVFFISDACTLVVDHNRHYTMG